MPNDDAAQPVPRPATAGLHQAPDPLRLDAFLPRSLEPSEAWIVREGYVDLFAQAGDDAARGRRHHVLRAGPGAVVLALPESPRLRLIAVGSQDATVACLTPAALTERDRDAALMRWCGDLARAVADAPPVHAPEARTLDAFHARIVARLDELIRDAARLASERLVVQRNADAAGLSASLGRLAGLPPTPAEHEPSQEDPCIAACRIAAQACGLTLAIPMAPALDNEPPIERIARIAGLARLRCRRVLLTGPWWRGDRGVLIALAGDAQAVVVLRPRPGRGYDRVAPGNADAARRVTRADAPDFAVDALQCYATLPGPDATPWRLVRAAARGSGRDAWNFLGTAVATGVLALAPPLAIALLFRSIIPHAETGLIVQVAAGLVLFALAAFCFELAKAAALARLEGRLGLNLGAVLIDRVLRLPVRFFASYASGDLADRLRGIEAIGRTLTGTTVVALLAGIFSSLNLVLLLWIDVRLALACTGLLVAGAAVSFGFHLVALRWERVAMRERGRLDGFVVQLVIGMTKLRTAAAERRALRVWARGFADLRDAVGRAQATQTGQQVFSAMLPLAVLALLFAGAVQLGTGSAQAAMSLGDFMVFSAALGNLLAALLTLSVELANVMRVVPLYERALPLLNAAPESDRPVTAGVSAMRAGGLQGEIELVDVSFRYDPAAPWALQEVSLRIAAGEMVAIVGTSGSGKSTILRLLLGFERPERGTVLLDGTPLDQFDLGLVRRGMGVVLQQSRLSPGNIFQNIVGHTGMNLDAAWEAARQASLAEDIEAMPMGMHTTVMENGQGLSGGQCQRLAIARALVARPRIILLDEATSALDNRTQDVVGRSLVGIAATRVVIAHRLSTIERADRILVMEEGRLVQSGTFDALMAEPGRFRELAARQML